jgi:hypothetical protein
VFRTLLSLVALSLLALTTPSPWGALWLAIPLAVASALLLCWRWGPWGVLVPVGLLALVMIGLGPFAAWAWWVPVAALTGSWMGLREEGGGPGSGQRAWMMLPVLLLAAGLPWSVSYPTLLQDTEKYMQSGDHESIRLVKVYGYKGEQLATWERIVNENAGVRKRSLAFILPSVLFLWMTLLVVAGRDLSSRIAARLRWPNLSRSRFIEWRLPDGAVWILIVGLGLVLTDFRSWLPTAWTLLIIPCLGYCVQGIAVVESLLLLRGMPSSIITLTMLFVSVMALPVFLLATACIGLSDVWLDYRRLEAAPEDGLS